MYKQQPGLFHPFFPSFVSLVSDTEYIYNATVLQLLTEVAKKEPEVRIVPIIKENVSHFLLNSRLVRRRKFDCRCRGFQIPVSLPYSELVGVEGHPATKNSLQYPWVDNWLMVIFLLVVKLSLVKCRQRFDCLPWGKRLTLA